MVQQYEYAYRVWKCKLDDRICDLDGACDRCYWAKTNKEWEDLNSQKTPNSLESSKIYKGDTS